MKRVLIVGGSGQVARALMQELKGRELYFTSSSGREGSFPLDLGDPASIRSAFANIRRHFGPGNMEVYLAGALTHVDKCEQEKERCRQINWLGPALVAQECRDLEYGLTYFSSEYVFGNAEYEGGAVGPFREEDPPAPTSWYGECKLQAEQAVEDVFGPDGALIVRTTMVYSWDPTGMNFLMQYLRQLENPAQPFRIPVDQISSPAYAPSLASAVVRLRDANKGGLFHLVGPDLLSRKELVEKVAEEFGFGSGAAAGAFRFVRTAELGQAARRPLTAGLLAEKANRQGIRMASLSEAFAEIKKLRG